MLVKAEAHDVVPARGVVALEALIDARGRLARHRLRDHAEVAHQMARRWLVALHAVGGTGCGVLKARYHPRRKRMALAAVVAHAFEMGVFTVVAAHTVERLARGAGIKLLGAIELQPGFQRLQRCGTFGIWPDAGAEVPVCGARDGSHADLRQRQVIHRHRPHAPALMLEVAGGALLHTGVEGRGLTPRQPLRIGMADGAVGHRDADVGRVAGRTLLA